MSFALDLSEITIFTVLGGITLWEVNMVKLILLAWTHYFCIQSHIKKCYLVLLYDLLPKKGINIAIFQVIFAEKYFWTYIFHIFSKIWMFCFYVQKIPLSYLVVAKKSFVMILNILGYQTNFNASETLSNLIWKQPLTGVLHKLSVLPTTNSSKVRFKFLTKSLKNTCKRVHF